MTQDSAWKEVLEQLFKEFLAFFFPQIYKDIDFARGYEFLDKELLKITKDSRIRKRIVDKLVKVYLLDGTEKWLLIHIEIQGYREQNFPERMYIYNYRIFDKFHKEVISLAVFTDTDINYRPKKYIVSRWGFELVFRFPIIKLIDYRDQWDELEICDNPFCLVVMSYLKTLETKGDYQQQYRWKKHFLSSLYHKGLERETIFSMYKFIDWMMSLPEELENEIFAEIIKVEEEQKMSVLTTAERIGREKGEKEGWQKGLQKGLQQGVKQSISDILEIKFGFQGLYLFKRVEKINDIDKLEIIRNGLKKSQTLPEAEKIISTVSTE